MSSLRCGGVPALALAGAFFIGGLLLAASTAWSATASVTVTTTSKVDVATARSDPEALALLRAASEAWRQGNFSGRVVYVRGNRVDSMQVVHALFDGVEHERVSHLDETAAEIIRRGDETVYVHHDARLTLFESAGAAGPFRPFAAMDADLGKVYLVQRKAVSRVAGRTADHIVVLPRDAHRYGYRVWLDAASRLPLRYEITGRHGRVLESVEFVDLETGISVPRDLFATPDTGAARTVTSTQVADAPLPQVAPSWLPAGFRVSGSSVHQGDGESARVSAVTYSDGVAAFSFFVEPAQEDARPIGFQLGPTVAVGGVLDAGEGGRYLVTLVGEVPAATAVKIIESARLGKASPAAEAAP